jgi:hypothetical protein
VRLFAFIALFMLVGAPLALAGPGPRDLVADGSPLSLEDGRGIATVRGREGTIFGEVSRGRVRAVNTRVSGCEIRRRVNRRTVVCIGRELTFLAIGRRWTITARGSGISASGRLKGLLTLWGTRGTYSLEWDHGDERPWPLVQRTFIIG